MNTDDKEEWVLTDEEVALINSRFEQGEKEKQNTIEERNFWWFNAEGTHAGREVILFGHVHNFKTSRFNGHSFEEIYKYQGDLVYEAKASGNKINGWSTSVIYGLKYDRIESFYK